MLERILVPIDGSDLSSAVFEQVRRVLLVKDAQVILVSVLPEDASEKTLIQLESRLEAHRASLRADGVRIAIKIVRGSDPAAKILEVADEVQPSLVAVATHGRSGVSRFVRGSVAERLLAASPFPLLLANPMRLPEKAPLSFRRILVPLDGSETSAAVLPLVHDLARIYESEVVLLQVLEMPSAVMLGEPLAVEAAKGVQRAAREMAESWLGEMQQRLGGVKTRIMTAWGSPAATILDTAASEGADLLAMTTHGRSGLSRWVYGSVAELVLHEARCPLLVQRTKE